MLTLTHGCKEDLVEGPRDWPGVHGVQALTEGKILEGLWFDRTQEYAARRRGEDFSRLQYATREILTLDPLLCWKDLTEEQRQRRAVALVADIEAEAAARRKKTGVKPMGPAAILTQDPHHGPPRGPRSLQPRPSMQPAKPCAVGSAKPTLYSWPPTAKPPRSSGRGTATCAFLLGTSLQACRSWAGKPSARCS